MVNTWPVSCLPSWNILHCANLLLKEPDCTRLLVKYHDLYSTGARCCQRNSYKSSFSTATFLRMLISQHLLVVCARGERGRKMRRLFFPWIKHDLRVGTQVEPPDVWLCSQLVESAGWLLYMRSLFRCYSFLHDHTLYNTVCTVRMNKRHKCADRG